MVRASKIVLIGGQAIALWGAQLAQYLPPEEAPVASRDVDFQGTSDDVELAAKLLEGRAYLPGPDDFTPQTGKTVFVDSEGHERTLDFLAQPHGLDAEDVRDSAIEIDLELEDERRIPLWVMHPERCLRSRLANTRLPGKRTTLARRQLISAIKLVPAVGRLLLDSEVSPRTITKLNERIFELAYYNRDAMRLYLDEDIDVFEAILADGRLPARHLNTRLPQMRPHAGREARPALGRDDPHNAEDGIRTRDTCFTRAVL